MPKKIPQLVKLVQESKIKQTRANKHISYSQLSSFENCPKQWYLTYVKNLAPYKPSIHAVFGTAMHETIQTWLDVLYNDTIKKANEMDLSFIIRKYAQGIQSSKSYVQPRTLFRSKRARIFLKRWCSYFRVSEKEESSLFF